MALLKESKTNWKFIIIVLVLAILVGGGVLLLAKIQEFSFIQFSGIKKTEKPSQKDETAGWKTYGDEEYGFEVKYPNIYKITASSELNEYQKSQGMTYLVYLKRSDADASISVWLTNINFNLQNIKQRFAPTGNESPPEQVTAGQNIFYFYGHGGGGVSYPDNYFYNLNGKILVISFDGPYINDKTPSDETKQLELQILSSFKFIEKDETVKCSPIDIPNYEVYAALKVDLNGDRKEEFVRVYREYATSDIPTLPIAVKIFSGTEECPKENFSYQGTENQVWDAQAFLNFWGDGANAVMVTEVIYAGGSGSSVVLRFFTYRNGEYIMIEGPQFGGHNWQCCKFAGENGSGKKIIGAESRWAENYSDYCAGCPSRFQFYIYIWDGKEYIKTEAGITKNKYSGSIAEILQKEPSVLEELE